MKKQYLFQDIKLSKKYNYLQVTLINNSTSCDCVTISLYDTSTSDNILVFQNKYYLSPHSTKIIVIPLVINNYDDQIVLNKFHVSYTKFNSCTTVSTLLLYSVN